MADEGENDMLACMSFAKEHQDQPGGNSPIKRLIDIIKRPNDNVGMFTNADTTIGLVGRLHLEQDGQLTVEGPPHDGETIAPMGDDLIISLTAVPSRSTMPAPSITGIISASYPTRRESAKGAG